MLRFDPSHYNIGALVVPESNEGKTNHYSQLLDLNILLFSGPFRATDGKSACHIKEFVITSPNSEMIPQPQWNESDVRLRADYRYGPDDYTLWPQPYVEANCHLGAVSRKPSDLSNPLSIMWWNPTELDFTAAQGSLLNGFGTLSTEKSSLFKSLCSSLSTRVRASLQAASKPNSHLQALLKAMEHAACRLDWCSGLYLEMRFSVTELQRFYLKVLAFIDYIEIYKPRMDGARSPAKELASCIGAFTSLPRVVQDFVEAGLPVYFIRPAAAVFTASPPKILKVVSLLEPEAHLVLCDATPRFPTIFRGSANTPMKHLAMHRYSRTWMVYKNPHDSTAAPISVNPFQNNGVVPNASDI